MNSAMVVGEPAWTAQNDELFHQDVDFLGDFHEVQDGACIGASPDDKNLDNDDDSDDDVDDDDFDDEFDDDFDESSDTDDDFDEDLDEESDDIDD